jgi:peptidyl-tRNA hydrolase, PTH1 family
MLQVLCSAVSEQGRPVASSARLICGLGNPGDKYEFTRHNIGFLIADQLSSRMNVRMQRRSEFLGDFATGQLGGHSVHVLKPITYMNRSGKSVAPAVAAMSLDARTSALIVVDDVHLPFGQLRVRA